jgi:hypothetical protein
MIQNSSVPENPRSVPQALTADRARRRPVGQPGIELAGLVVDRHLLLVLSSRDMREREIVAHWATCVASVA